MPICSPTPHFPVTPSRRYLILFILSFLLLVALLTCFWLFADLPKLDTLPDRLNVPSVRIEDRHGQLLYESFSAEGGRHTSLSLEEISPYLRAATLATEDRNFYQHPGVDLWGILRAFWINLRGREVLAGGSTITQQVARTLLLSTEEGFENTIRRKLRESVLAWRLTRRYTKDEILALYLNQINYGAMSYGVEAAAQTYFGKSAAELDLAESALLAGLPQAPSLYNPLLNPKAAQERQKIVLSLMEKDGAITAQERQLAEEEPLAFSAAPYPMEAPHFVLWVRAQLDQMLSPEERASAITVRTTLDLNWQHHAERAIHHHLETIQNDKSGLGHNVHNAALAALNTKTGAIRTLVGSPDYFAEDIAGALNMALSPRQPGSALKPLIYAAAFDPSQPNPWTPATMILDVSRNFILHDGKSYAPKNYDNRFHGPVLVREALASSYNIPAVAALDHVGLETFYTLSANAGILMRTSPEESDLSVALGGGEVTLLELTAAYGAFSNGGYRVNPYSIASIRNEAGEILYQAAPQGQVRVFDERVAWLISDILSDNTARTPGFGPNSALLLDRPAAVKTGTTSNFHDNWTVGYTPCDSITQRPGLAVGVWVGNANHEPMINVDGLSGAAPIWHQFTRAVLSGVPESDFDPPPGLVRVSVCTLSGLLPTDLCPYQRLEWFIEGTQPQVHDTFYQEIMFDARTGLAATENTPLEYRQTRLVLDLPVEAQSWARGEGILLLSDFQTSGEGGADTPLLLLSPGPNTVYYLSSDMPQETQRIHLEALAQVAVEEVTLWVDEEVIAAFSQPPYEAWWTAEVGEHWVWVEATTLAGKEITSERVRFTVKAKGEE